MERISTKQLGTSLSYSFGFELWYEEGCEEVVMGGRENLHKPHAGGRARGVNYASRETYWVSLCSGDINSHCLKNDLHAKLLKM